MLELIFFIALAFNERAAPNYLSPRIRERHAPCLLAATSLSDLKVYELKAVCRAKGLKVSGRKAELIARIEAAPLGVASRPLEQTQKSQNSSPEDASETSNDFDSPISILRDDERGPRDISEGSPIPLPGSSSTSSAASPVRVQVDVVDEETERAAQRDTRRAARRQKLASYFSEEYTKLVGELEVEAGPAFVDAFGIVEQVSIGGGAALLRIGRDQGSTPPYFEAVQERGRRLAWCKRFDSLQGTGVLVDIRDGREFPVSRSDLCTQASVAVHARMLYPGEFVEYDAQLEGTNQSWVSGLCACLHSNRRSSTLATCLIYYTFCTPCASGWSGL